ncbi:MAG: phosphate acyltransferase PlsX [Chloroflexi bacterium]|nr:phosphate acyltransferase PlsX [Chloroflexota bacterium]
MTIRIVLDAMGSDNRPQPELEGALMAASQSDLEIILIGDETILKEKLAALSSDQSNLRIIHAPQALEMSDHIAEARTKKDNSMRVGMDLVKAGEADAFLTMGNTGMAMYFGMKSFGLIKGVQRPALCASFPVKDSRAVVLDIGANAESRPEFLVQFAQMGAIYARLMQSKANPKVGLLANGEEEGKGNDLVKSAGPMMRDQLKNFVGNVEAKEFFAGKVDVLVTDGFTGNIMLKASESVAKLLLETLKAELLSSLRTKIGALLAKPAFNKVRKLLDPNEVGAAPLLGIDGLLFIGHGRSDARAVLSGIMETKKAIEKNLLGTLKDTFQKTEG